MSRSRIQLELNEKIFPTDIDCIFRKKFMSKDLDKNFHMTLKDLLNFHGRSMKADHLISEAISYQSLVGF